jgi:uncharacterized protein (TIGR00369 family)
VLATLVDLLGGGLAARAAIPDWIATADLTLHLVPRPVAADIEARGVVLRKGRTTVVIEVALHAADGGPGLGVATMSFAVLPRREGNPVITAGDQDGGTWLTFADEESGFETGLHEAIGLVVVDRPAGVVELPTGDYVRNTLGAVQGGVVAALVDAAAEHALREACGMPVETVDVQMTYLALSREGPIRSSATVLRAEPEFGVAHVELRDAGAADRVTAIGRVVAARPRR